MSLRTHPPSGRIDVSPGRAAAISALVAAVFVAVRLIPTRGIGGFPVVGDALSNGTHGVRIYDEGYDGQFVYRLTLAPLTRAVTANGITLDIPAYRQQRIATAFFAHILDAIPGVSAALALVLVNFIAVIICGVAAAYLTAEAGRSLKWAPLLAVPACLPISLGRDLTEPVAWAAILLAVLASRRGRWFAVAVALTVAVLARETSLLVIGGFGLQSLFVLARREPRAWARFWLLVPIGVESGWQIWLAHVWHSRIPLLLGSNNASSVPVLSVAENFFAGLPSSGLFGIGLGLSYLIERLALLSLILVTLWQVAARRVRADNAETFAWAAAAVLALTLHDWGKDVQFLRATYEAWGLSVLLLLSVKHRAADIALVFAGIVTLGVAGLYMVRV